MDREKIIKDLEFCVNGHYKVELSLATKILSLLKEQKEKMEHLNNITLEYEKEVFRLQTLLKEQEVVRCKDCKHYDEETGRCYWGVVHGNAETWFCADGERRTDDA